DADEVDAGNDDGGISVCRDAGKSATALEARGYIDIALCGQGESLGASEAAVPDACFAMRVNGPDGIVRRERGACNEQRALGIHGEVIGGDTGFEGGVDEDFALRINFKNCAATIADEEIALCIEDSARGNAHAFGIESGLAGAIDAVDISLGARGDKEIAFGAEGQAGGIEDSGDEGSSAAV